MSVWVKRKINENQRKKIDKVEEKKKNADYKSIKTKENSESKARERLLQKFLARHSGSWGKYSLHKKWSFPSRESLMENLFSVQWWLLKAERKVSEK